MTGFDDAATPGPDTHFAPPSAGATLRATREAAGIALEEAAQQLKLAPRQVQALEDDDYAKLPGRTFVRGFVRNYARFLQLDPDELLALLPGSDVAPALERPTITPSGRPMGELPADAPARRAWTRWLIPLVLVAIVVAAGLYEFQRQQGESRRASVEKAASAPAVSSTTGTVPTSSAALPNPLTASPAPATAPSSAATTEPATAPPTPALPPAAAPAPATPSTEAAAPEPAASPAPAEASQPQLVVNFKGKSWIQVKDRNGNTLLAENAPAGSTQTVSGPLPLDVVIGDAREVSATFAGQPIDLSLYVRGTVARFSIK